MRSVVPEPVTSTGIILKLDEAVSIESRATLWSNTEVTQSLQLNVRGETEAPEESDNVTVWRRLTPVTGA